jgi:hypothetical protein
MRYAFVQNGVVQEAWSRDPVELFGPGYASQFVNCPDEVEQGWTFDGSNWTAPSPLPQAFKPTKEQLLAQLQALEAQILALE